jgi:hypothetical protein
MSLYENHSESIIKVPQKNTTTKFKNRIEQALDKGVT